MSDQKEEERNEERKMEERKRKRNLRQIFWSQLNLYASWPSSQCKRTGVLAIAITWPATARYLAIKFSEL
jgi:hypothetical protein